MLLDVSLCAALGLCLAVACEALREREALVAACGATDGAGAVTAWRASFEGVAGLSGAATAVLGALGVAGLVRCATPRADIVFRSPPWRAAVAALVALALTLAAAAAGVAVAAPYGVFETSVPLGGVDGGPCWAADRTLLPALAGTAAGAALLCAVAAAVDGALSGEFSKRM